MWAGPDSGIGVGGYGGEGGEGVARVEVMRQLRVLVVRQWLHEESVADGGSGSRREGARWIGGGAGLAARRGKVEGMGVGAVGGVEMEAERKKSLGRPWSRGAQVGGRHYDPSLTPPSVPVRHPTLGPQSCILCCASARQ